MPSSRESSRPREQTLTYYVSCIYKRFLYHYHHLRSHRTFWRVLWNLRTARSKGWEEEAFTIDSPLVKGGPHFWIMHLWLENKFPWLSHIATSEKLWSRKQKVHGRVLTVPGSNHLNLAKLLSIKCEAENKVTFKRSPTENYYQQPRHNFFFLATPRGMQDLSSGPRIKPIPVTLEAWSLNHWTTREVPAQT